jgi:hypothetical protein
LAEHAAENRGVGSSILPLATLHRDLQGRGLSASAVKVMSEIARGHGFDSLIAPVRPSWKERYPLVPIHRYAVWRRPDGWPFDPWMRVHARLGADILRPAPHSLHITGTGCEWENWTAMPFTETGEYWFPGGLTTVTIDRGADRGRFWEPNVWMRNACNGWREPIQFSDSRIIASAQRFATD